MRMRALQALGHDVVGLDTEPTRSPTLPMRVLASAMRRLGHPLQAHSTSRQLLDVVYKVVPQIVWIDKGLVIRPEALRSIHQFRKDVLIVGYSPDDMGQRDNQSRYFLTGLPEYDWFFTTKTFNVDELKAMGVRRPCFLGNGFDPATHRRTSVSAHEMELFGGPVGFVGSYERDRANQILSLARAGFPVKVWGWGKTRSPLSVHPNLTVHRRTLLGSEYAKALCSFAINLGFLRKINRDRQTTRSIEIPACGAFMLAERTDEHLELFEEGKEAEFFASTTELIDKTRYYLGHDSQRIRIAAAGYERCRRSGYDYPSRMRQALDKLVGDHD